jgi:hypothetical protein
MRVRNAGVGRLLWPCLVSVCLAACANFMAVESFKPGELSLDQVRAKAKPDAEWKNADGGVSLAYDNRPNSEQNLMLDFDAKGKLVAVRELITRENIALLRPAMTRTEVRRLLGAARYTYRHHATGGDVWEWPTRVRTGTSQEMVLVQFHPTADGVVRIATEMRQF